MLCAVYKSLKKEGTFLYVKQRDDFSAVPDALLNTFGSPVLVTLLNLAKREHLALADIDKVKQQLTQQGYYLQLPPPVENLLAQHKAQSR
ncbi:YcgL domain-containing protein [Rheinheimera baltica]|uniref:YcgL domain-containing protein ORJ04_06870 n=1 Tax=Rheinheimera baltica TaxID=67576 RepID=A0ABT9HX20_9GAMM|nr:YcgL domain-containing protein [Rheinheimera baltica]MDP5135669.1 YcgL domain-containing protein [Rheinheimera baltica]MDP5191157.1 YcgL domain-containing protein [Rheinheimera baltica]